MVIRPINTLVFVLWPWSIIIQIMLLNQVFVREKQGVLQIFGFWESIPPPRVGVWVEY